MASRNSSDTSIERPLSVIESVFQLEQSLEHRMSDLRHLEASIRHSITAGHRLIALQAAAAVPRLLAGLRKLSDYTNAVAPVNSLPPELHRLVFKHAVIPRTGELFHGKYIVRLTHVCRLWRKVAIGDASLWCHIDLKAKEPLWQLCIQRSSGFSIELHLSTHGSMMQSLRDVVKQHMTRIRAIYMDGGTIRPPQVCYYDYADCVLNCLRPTWERPPPLECLFIRGWLNGRDWQRIEWTILDKDSPSLRALCLLFDDVWQWLPQNRFPNLTHLCLSPQSPNYQRYSVEQLLQLLFRAPMLQYLHLSLSQLYSHSRGPLPIVRLHHVRMMSIHESRLEATFFLLKHLELPDDVLLCIDGSALLPTLEESEPDHDALRIPPLGLLNTITFMELSVSSTSFFLAGYNAHFTSGFYIDTSAPELSKMLGGPWLEDLHTMIPLHNVTTLHVNIDEPKTILPSILPRFRYLQELCLLVARPPLKPGNLDSGRQMVETFLSALDPGIAAGPLDVRFPHLQVVGLEAALSPSDFPSSVLQSMAASRMRAGHRLHRFVYHPHTHRYDTERTRGRFSSAFLPLAAFVDEVEYRRVGDARVCPFTARECWDQPEAERYWPLPKKLGYGFD